MFAFYIYIIFLQGVEFWGFHVEAKKGRRTVGHMPKRRQEEAWATVAELERNRYARRQTMHAPFHFLPGFLTRYIQFPGKENHIHW